MILSLFLKYLMMPSTVLLIILDISMNVLSTRLWSQLGREGHTIDLMRSLPNDVDPGTVVRLQSFLELMRR